MKRWIMIAVVLLIVAAFAGGAWSSFSSSLPVATASVQTAPIRQFVEERAKTRLPRVYRITTPTAGRIEEVELDVGSPVVAGQVVARMDREDLGLRIAAVQAAVDRLEASRVETLSDRLEQMILEQSRAVVASMEDSVRSAAARVEAGEAKYEYSQVYRRRVEQLLPSGARTQDDLDRAILAEVESRVAVEQDRLVHGALSALEAATSLLPDIVQQLIDDKQLTAAVTAEDIRKARAELEQLQLDARRAEMQSPVDGVVLERNVVDARQLPAGETVLVIGRLDDLEIEAELLTQDAVEVKAEQAVELHGPEFGDSPVRARVYRVDPAGFTKISSLGVEQQRVLVIIRLDEAERNRLVGDLGMGVDYRVRARIVTAEKPQTTIIPRTALFRDVSGEWNVFAVRDGAATRVAVEVGLINDEEVEIAAGLTAGDTVIVSPPSELVDGQAVAAQPSL
jgi:HlyD family secretion protein